MPIVVWQLVFFVFPLLFLLLMSFWLVKNYRMVPGFDSVNWIKMYSKGYFWDGYWRTLGYAGITTVITSVLAFPVRLLWRLRSHRLSVGGLCFS